MPTIYQRQNKSRNWAPSIYKVYERARVCTDMKIYFFPVYRLLWVVSAHYTIHTHFVDLGDSRKSECPYNRASTKWRALQVVIAMVTIFTVQKFTCREYIRRRRLGLSLHAAADWRCKAFTFCAVQYFSLWQHAVIIMDRRGNFLWRRPCFKDRCFNEKGNYF